MKDPEYLKYKCSRCRNEMTDNDEVLVITVVLGGEKTIYDFCNKCKKDFKDFINAFLGPIQN
jgi:hypothetical protein